MTCTDIRSALVRYHGNRFCHCCLLGWWLSLFCCHFGWLDGRWSLHWHYAGHNMGAAFNDLPTNWPSVITENEWWPLLKKKFLLSFSSVVHILALLFSSLMDTFLCVDSCYKTAQKKIWPHKMLVQLLRNVSVLKTVIVGLYYLFWPVNLFIFVVFGYYYINLQQLTLHKFNAMNSAFCAIVLY